MKQLRTQSDLRTAFKEYNIWARKELGQNFLIDHNLLEFLVRAGEVGPDDFLLDVGAGTGLLTRHLSEQGWQVWAVEIDRRLFDFCSAYTSGLPNVRLLNQDVLKDKYHLDPELETAILAELGSRPGTNFKVVSNLPYSISTLLIPNLLQGPIPVRLMVLTVQKEVGERLTAKPGSKDYGSLSVIVQTLAHVKILKVLSSKVFWPRPKVDSAIVRVDPRTDRRERVRDLKWLSVVAQALFSARRKKAINALKQDERLGLPPEQIEAAFERLGLNPNDRGEVLSVDQIIDLSNELRPDAGNGPRGA
jgi:16S rRNA (adenine1518-N6/adenine1519-N6)-dimethyltransferase